MHKPTAIGLLVKFLKELQDERQASADEAPQEDNGESPRGIYVDFAKGYISNDYITKSFDPYHLEEAENKDKPYITRQYVKFYKKHGYISRYFSVKNCAEVIDTLPTLTTSCGSKSGMGPVGFFYVREEISLSEEFFEGKDICLDVKVKMLQKY